MISSDNPQSQPHLQVPGYSLGERLEQGERTPTYRVGEDRTQRIDLAIDGGAVNQQSPDFDLASVLQSVRVLSSTLDLEDLLQKMVQIILTHSGAQTCILALPDSAGEWQIRAIATVNADRPFPIHLPQPLADTSEYPVNAIYWVKNAQQPIAFDARKPLGIPDRYLLKYQPQSVFCLPILQQSAIFGVVYLEHQYDPDIFTQERKITISCLCAQAAIAIENAKLYQAAQELAAKLQKQQSYLQTLLDNIPHMAWLKDENRRYIAVNRVIAEIAGQEPAAMVGRNDFDCWPIELAQAYQDDDLQVMISGERQVVEEKIMQPNGAYRWLETIKTLIRDSAGKIAGSVGIARDITERRQIEQELRESQRQYQQLANNIPGIIYQLRMTPDGSITYPYVSSGCEELLEISPAEVMNDPRCLLDLIHPEDVAIARQLLVESARDLKPRTCEGRAVLASGQVKWVKSVSRPELQPDGAIVWDGLMLDITDRKRAELDLATSQQKYYSLIQSIPGVVWEYDFRLNKFNFVNDRAEALLGYPVEAWIAQPDFWADRLHPDDRDATIQLYSDAIDNRQSCEAEYRLIAADGRIAWVYDIATPVLDLHGKSIATNGLMLDITERQVALHERQLAEIALHETNERLESTNRELRRATKLKDEFLATMSHELRTPLNAILGMSECLEEGVFGAINERQAKSIETIHRSGQHLLSLINDILDVSKIAAGKLELEISTVSIHRLCDSSLAFVKQQADRKQIHLDIDLPPQIDTCCLDERRIRQVLINLLSNAVKFTPKGGRITLAVEIVVTTERAASVRHDDTSNRSDWLRIAVTDTGIGISPADRDRLFEPFIQIDSSLNRQYEGTGLGLALVKQMVELHGGYVTLESELGRGSCFSVYLAYSTSGGCAAPLALRNEHLQQSLLLDPVEQHDSNTSARTFTTFPQPTILLAEDDRTNLITFVSYLNVKGYRTIVAKDGAEAIELARLHQPDLILMDIQMPGVDGIEAILQIRQHSQLARIPIVALTALAMAVDRQKCLNAGANKCLVKPVKLKELNRTIQQCLDLN